MSLDCKVKLCAGQARTESNRYIIDIELALIK